MKNQAILPPAPEIITARPEGMSDMEYKLARKESRRKITKRLKNGFLVWLSNEVLFDDHQPPRPIGMRYLKGLTFVGDTDNLQPV